MPKEKKVAVIQNIDTIFSLIISLHKMSIRFFHLVPTSIFFIFTWTTLLSLAMNKKKM